MLPLPTAIAAACDGRLDLVFLAEGSANTQTSSGIYAHDSNGNPALGSHSYAAMLVTQ